MTIEQLYSAYLLWLNENSLKLPRRIFDFPAANCDIFEDDHFLINRLFFLVPHVFDGKLRCFSFFEDNTFSKDDSGDLSLVRSSLHLLS